MQHFVTLPRPMPTPWFAAEMFSKLLARRVTIRSTKPMNVKTGKGAMALYEDDQKRLTLLGACELPLVCHAAAALTQIPRSAALEAIKEGPSPNLVDNFAEVMNVLARLLTYPNTSHVRMTRVSLYQKGLLPDYLAQVGNAKSTMCWAMDIADYGAGTMMILDLQA